METLKDKLQNIVGELHDKYENNQFIFNKFVSCIEQLPELLDNTNTRIIEKEKRKNKLQNDSESFIPKFLHNNKFYYNTSSELFFEYKNNKFSLIKEDDVQHCILTTISANKSLTDWKQKLKVTLLKKIKERDLFSCIPESETIQTVISKLSTNLFEDKEKSKYFLTLLGDILLKKHTNLTYFINIKFKPIIKELSNLSCMILNTSSLLNIFKFKYYEHTFHDCRIIDFNNSINIEQLIAYIKDTNALDIFCVAVYYSKRYNSADEYLSNHCKDEKFKNHALFLKDKTEQIIVEDFYGKNIEHNTECNISWKSIQYLWKLYIESENIPNILFNNTLKTRLQELYKYNSETDVLMESTSKFLPVVSKFISFWNENIITSDNDNDELEIDEISALLQHNNKVNMNEKTVIDLIKHYYPDSFIEEDKYIYNVKCKLWDKRKDIISFVNKLKKNGTLEQDIQEISIHELYQHYLNEKKKFTVSKKFFERFIKDELELYIIEDNFIKVKSLDNIL